MIFILVSLFVLQNSILAASTSKVNLGFDPHNLISEIYVYDEIESSSWVEVGLRQELSKNKVGSECEGFSSVECNAAKGSTSVVKQAAVHGNSLKSLKPTWGYKLYSADGTFLKNGITNKLIPETRYTKAFMQGKYMDAIPFSNRLGAYQWEFGQNQILRGPLNLNMH